jgi:CheY-like chemotaxis protein
VERVEAQIPPNRSVLVIDDDVDVRESLVDVIQETGREAFGAASAVEALGRLEALPRPCLILLDIMMPGMNGFEFLEIIQQRPDAADFPVLVISASSAIERARYYTAVLGALRKPLGPRDLRAALDKIY